MMMVDIGPVVVNVKNRNMAVRMGMPSRITVRVGVFMVKPVMSVSMGVPDLFMLVLMGMVFSYH